METIAAIRQLYHPVQPAVQTVAGVTYTEWPPAELLRPYIYCYWQLKTVQRLEQPFMYRVVADGCIDLYFEPANSSENYVMGFCNRYTTFALPEMFHYIGIRFLPSMFSLLFGIPAAALSNRYEKLDAVLPGTAGFIVRYITPGSTIQEIKYLLDNHFATICSQRSLRPDNRFYEALVTLMQCPAGLRVQKDLDTGISPRQLRRLFEHYIGDTAKTFSQVVRFQHLLRQNPTVQHLRTGKLFWDAGYYDQAHFIKAFKRLYGLTPVRAFL